MGRDVLHARNAPLEIYRRFAFPEFEAAEPSGAPAASSLEANAIR